MTTTTTMSVHRLLSALLLALLAALAAATVMPSNAQPAAAAVGRGGSVWRLLDAARGHGPEANGESGRRVRGGLGFGRGAVACGCARTCLLCVHTHVLFPF